jgi:SAM-dependent methyltransferase
MTQRKDGFDLSRVSTPDVKQFWQANPLCVQGNPHIPGSLEFFEFYDGQRESIESIPYSHALHEYREFKGKKVLDVGCGNGYVLANYASEGAEVFGIDITEAGIDLCRKRFEYRGLSGNFRVADAQELPFTDNTFDCVCSMGVLHHVPDTQKALDEIHRVLKPGGRLILMFYHRHSAKYQFKYRVWSLATGKPMRQLVNEFDGVGNPKGTVFSKKELRGILVGFSDIRMHLGFLETRDIILRGARFLPDRLFQPLAPLIGWNLYAKARKPL